jgi:hypothetical protein
MGATTPVLGVVLGDEQLEELARRIVSGLLGAERDRDEWLDLASAARHLRIHPDTLRKRARGGLVPYEQAGPGCRVYFRRSDLDAWRESGACARPHGHHRTKENGS